ncbi:Wzz/FepE/Etk N-terminal domain-containing protein [Pseudoalteromonas ruthenica]|uniref:Wzz/FepE/Etk N-terminal domain-containing protein n=1 Tax=Pseudoalteromonas ruthenica TaxID=151081 RepID=UPI000345C3D3|nr:Wzz/FepE/Etk N-terminal domain-containing protein [Pseudoalteromonas ruthenica]
MKDVTPEMLVKWAIQDWLKIIAFTVLAGACAVAYALSLPNKYTSQASVTSNFDDGSSVGGALGKLGGLAGMSFSGGGEGYSSEVMREMMLSADFLGPFIQRQGIEPTLMAAQDFDRESRKFIINSDIYDSAKEIWTRVPNYPQKKEPSSLELATKFKESFNVKLNKQNGLIGLSFESYSPEFSLDILDSLIEEFNLYLKEKDLLERQKKLKYLKSELESSNLVEVRTVLQQLVEDEYKKLSVAKTREEYAIKVIEQPQMPIEKSSPRRAIICIGITGVSCIVFVLLLWFVRIFRL